MSLSMTQVWLIAVALFLLIEFATTALTTIWFAGGSLAALIAAALGAPLWLQIVLFLAVSAVLLLSLRPFARRISQGKDYATNVDSNIGKLAVVVEPIDNLRGTGRVMIGPVDWTARSEDGSVIAEGEKVRVLRVEGVKVCVEREAVGAEV